MNAATLVQKLWNYCNVLRDDGMSYGDYVEQLTYLLRISANVTADFGIVTGLRVDAGLRRFDCRDGGGCVG